MTDTSPLILNLTANADAQGTAGVVAEIVGEAPVAGVITSASFTPATAIVGNDTDYRTLKVVNKGAAGAGTLIAAALALNVAGTGGTLAAGDEKALTIDTARDDVAKGDILSFEQSIAAGGLANPGGLVQVEITRS